MMESTEFPSSRNGESKLIDFMPEFKITYLTKVKDPGIAKSPSWPSSPTAVRSDTGRKDASVPAYLTLGRKGYTRKVSDEEFGMTEDVVQTKRSSDPQIEEIRSVLSSLDLSKYMRKSKASPNDVLQKPQVPIRRCISVQPRMNSNYINGKKSFLDDIPPPPKTKSILHSSDDLTEDKGRTQRTYSLELTPIKRPSRTVNSKLKELTEKLRPSSAPPSPHRRQKPLIPYTAPPTSTFSFWKEPLPDTDVDLKEDADLKEDVENRCDAKECVTTLRDAPSSRREKLSEMTKALSLKNSKYATLPRAKQVNLNKSKSFEPRTLACLDLNTKPYKNNENFDLKTDFINESFDKNIDFENENFNKKTDFENEIDSINLKNDVTKNVIPEFQRSNKSVKPPCSPLQRQEECENNEDIIPTTTRRGSLKNNSGKRKDDFDLNFAKFGSLTYPKEKREERRKSLPKLDFQNADKISKSEEKNSSVSLNKHDETKDEITKCPEIEDMPHKKYQTYPLDLQAANSMNAAENFQSNQKIMSFQPQSAPVNSLEEEIRTIAKLLDGKESLFLKLIQSSKAENDNYKTENQNLESPRSFSPQGEISETVNSRSEFSQSVPLLRNTGRSSPSRLRAMTVPNADSNRSPAVSSLVSPPQQKRYFKKRLRGPYGEMLEQEMSKSVNKQRPSYAKDLDFLKELENLDLKNNKSGEKSPNRARTLLRSSSHSFDESHSITVDGTPKRKTSANLPIVGGNTQEGLRVPTSSVSGTVSEPILHIRSHSDSVKTSSAWNVDTILSGILKQPTQQDTRTHIVGELYETEVSYVESLQIVVKKYMIPLKSSDHSDEIDSSLVDQIFCRVPDILRFHEGFLDTLRTRLGYWDTKQKIGDVFVDVFTRSSVVDTYIEFINNWKSARDAIKSISLAKPTFAKFLEHTSREHKGKLTLDALLIMPVQRIPRYELLIKELLKHTPMDHPDYKLLLQAQREVHDLAIKINKVEREALQQEQMLQKLKEVEHLIEGAVDLSQGDRAFIRNDFVLIPGGLGLKKERCLFLFSDLLLISSVKKKGGAIRKTSLAVNSSSCGSLESNKYKLLMRTSLHNVDIVKKIDEPCVTKFMKEISTLENDIATVGKMTDLMTTLSFQNQILDEALREILSNLNKQLAEKQASSSQMMSLELSIVIDDETRNLTFIFPNPEQRMTWEIAFSEAKERLDKSVEKTSPPEFLYSLPLRKARAGLQITCAAAVADACQSGLPDLWICSSDGYVGQVSVLAFQNEPVISSSVSVSNSRILCIAPVPGISSGSLLLRRRSTLLSYLPGFKYERLGREEQDSVREKNFPLDSDSDDEFIDATEDDFPFDETNIHQSTMWLGTEDGWIYVYNCADTKLKKAKLKIQHSSCIYDILHVDSQVFVSLANGEIAVYSRDPNGCWNTSSPVRIHVATDVSPISKMMLIKGNLWCSTLNSIVIIDTESLEIEHTFQVASDLMRHITSIVPSSYGVWMTIQSSPVIHLHDATSYERLFEVNVSLPVTKMLSGCDDIIRQHKLACLRVSSLCVEKDLLWIGTSAGVILNLTMSSISAISGFGDAHSNIEGLLQGHSGHVRFLTSICASSGKDSFSSDGSSIHSGQMKSLGAVASTSSASPYSAVVISGGDGYEDFGSLDETEATGRDDSTNHLLMWRV